MTNDTIVNINVKQKKEYYLDPYFFGKVKTKGDLLQCFTINNKPIGYKDLNIHQKVFYKLKATATQNIVFNKGIPINIQALKIFKLKSWAIVLILLKIALHKQLSIGKVRLLYKNITKKNIYPAELFKMLSSQKALCVQLNGHILQIVYDKPAGLIKEDGTPWSPQPTQFQIDNLARAREIQQTKRVFLPMPDDYIERQEEAIKAANDYFADMEWDRMRDIG